MAKHGSLELTPRLQALADWVAPGAAVADIGTDHAFLPVWLALHQRVSSAIASDLREGPLAHAMETAVEWGVTEQIQFRLQNGLNGFSPHDADTIVIAGMGGENIAAILSDAPWTADGRHTLLLQSMSRTEVLRRFLADHGYQIRRERLVRDRGTIYAVMDAAGGSMALTTGQCYGGAALLHDPIGDRYLIEKIVRLQAAVGGLDRSAASADAAKADQLRGIIAELMKMREEWRHANCGSN
jgi:tRNA (adenine22-N1)-methyltransferase